MKIIGITGTKGKSTVVELTEKILKEAGYKIASFSSIKIKIGDNEKKNLFKMTMPGRWHIQKFLKDALKAKCDYAILEVTSEGILQHRQKFIDFEVVVFTNLSPEHIERHGSFENYRSTKMKLFKENNEVHILNLDDKNIDYFLKFPAKRKIFFVIKKGNINIRSICITKKSKVEIIKAKDCQEKVKGVYFKVNNIDFNLNLFGEFNISNALAAICICLSQKVSLDVCKKSLEKIKKIPGRMEVVIKEPFKVIVDYAHTPDSLEAVYKNLKKRYNIREICEKISSNSRLVCVLGAAGGGRDKWKRPKLGKIAKKYCDEIIITNEDPYDENPLKIMEEIESGFSQISNSKKQILKKSKIPIKKIPSYKKILDRRIAINTALKSAQKEDIVIITGKGCEPWMCIEKGRKIPWDDRKVVKEELEKLDSHIRIS